MGDYLTRDERVRRIGELLLKGVYLLAEAAEGTGSPAGPITSSKLLGGAEASDIACCPGETAAAAGVPDKRPGRRSRADRTGAVISRSTRELRLPIERSRRTIPK